jgi:hypothetical protein
MESLLETFLGGLLAIAILVAGVILGGWVLSVVWGWVMVPTFGLPTLSIPIAICLTSIVGYLTNSGEVIVAKIEKADDATSKFAHIISHCFVNPLAFLGIVWFVLLFV